MGTEITALPNLLSVTYDTYANFPTSPAVQDLAYATDRKVLYRWSGAAWEYLTQYHGFGAHAVIPTAADLPDGSTYYETDTLKTFQVQTASWVEINAAAASLTIAQTEVYNANSPTSWTDLDLSGTIGAKASLVLLKFVMTAGIDEPLGVRKNGDTDEFYNIAASTKGYGCALGDAYVNIHLVLWVATDAAGIIEWKAGAALNTVVDVIAFIN